MDHAIYVDVLMRFSLRSASKIFTPQGGALKWIIRPRMVQFIRHCIDNLIVCGPPLLTECAQALQAILVTCQELGIPITAPKVEGTATEITVISMCINTINQTLNLPDNV